MISKLTFDPQGLIRWDLIGVKINFKTLPLSWNLKKKHTMTRYLNKAKYGFQLDILGFQTIFIIRFWDSGSTSIAVESWSFFFTFQKQDKKLGPHFCLLIYFVLEVITLLFYKLSFFIACLALIVLVLLHCSLGLLVLFLIPFVTTQLFQAQISFEPSSHVWCSVLVVAYQFDISSIYFV